MLQTLALIIASLAAVAIILSVMFQTSKADGFSAAMGGGTNTARFKEGSKEAWLDKIAKVAAVIWVVACLVGAILWYKYR